MRQPEASAVLPGLYDPDTTSVYKGRSLEVTDELDNNERMSDEDQAKFFTVDAADVRSRGKWRWIGDKPSTAMKFIMSGLGVKPGRRVFDGAEAATRFLRAYRIAEAQVAPTGDAAGSGSFPTTRSQVGPPAAVEAASARERRLRRRLTKAGASGGSDSSASAAASAPFRGPAHNFRIVEPAQWDNPESGPVGSRNPIYDAAWAAGITAANWRETLIAVGDRIKQSVPAIPGANIYAPHHASFEHGGASSSDADREYIPPLATRQEITDRGYRAEMNPAKADVTLFTTTVEQAASFAGNIAAMCFSCGEGEDAHSAEPVLISAGSGVGHHHLQGTTMKFACKECGLGAPGADRERDPKSKAFVGRSPAISFASSETLRGDGRTGRIEVLPTHFSQMFNALLAGLTFDKYRMTFPDAGGRDEWLDFVRLVLPVARDLVMRSCDLAMHSMIALDLSAAEAGAVLPPIGGFLRILFGADFAWCRQNYAEAGTEHFRSLSPHMLYCLISVAHQVR